jgi:hypothetical protein
MGLFLYLFGLIFKIFFLQNKKKKKKDRAFACFNILNQEDRRVAAALIALDPNQEGYQDI